MPLDKKGLVERARRAGSASAKARWKKTIPRDAKLILAYKRLTGAFLSKDDEISAIKFLKSIGLGPNPPEDGSVLNHLAIALGLTKDRVQRILRKAKKISS
ncbi:hypothetical protein [Nitrosomonas sp. wSCUT-2]